MKTSGVDLTGQTFAELTVLHESDRRDKSGNIYWHCRCSCGVLVEVIGRNIRNGNTQSCGHLHREWSRSGSARRRHGHKPATKASPEYNAYYAMRGRCLNPKNTKYGDYGGRGISICDDWLSGGFDKFLADVGPKPEPKREYLIDRVDVNGNYEPSNVRWAHVSVSAKNKRPYKKAA